MLMLIHLNANLTPPIARKKHGNELTRKSFMCKILASVKGTGASPKEDSSSCNLASAFVIRSEGCQLPSPLLAGLPRLLAAEKIKLVKPFPITSSPCQEKHYFPSFCISSGFQRHKILIRKPLLVICPFLRKKKK